MKKKILALTVLLMCGFTGAFAQKYAYIEMKTVLSQLPQYRTVMSQIEADNRAYQQKAKEKLDAVQQLFDEYQKQRNSLSESYRRLVEEEIIRQEKEANQYQAALYDPQGEVMQQQQALIKPVQERVNAAIAAVARERGLDMIFDASSDNSIVYKAPGLNLTQAVIDRLNSGQ